MKKKDLKLNIKKIDTNEVDLDAFGESLLICAPRVREFCKYIDTAVTRVAHAQFEHYVDTLDQCNYIIENIYAKRQLMDLNKVVANWYKALPDRQKRAFKTYFVDRGEGVRPGYLRKMKYRKDRVITPMIRSFMAHLRTIIDFNEKALINNYYINLTYSEVLKRNMNRKKFV